MKTGPLDSPLNRSAAMPALRSPQGSHPGHAHSHDHLHDHGLAPTHSHAHPAPHASGPRTAAPNASLLMSSAMLRLAGAIGLTILLWAAVAWALTGTP